MRMLVGLTPLPPIALPFPRVTTPTFWPEAASACSQVCA